MDAAAEVKAYLRIVGAEEDALVARLVGAAMEAAEAYTGAALIRRARDETVAASAAWTPLAWGPVTAITDVAAEAYAVDIDAGGRGWVRVTGPVSAGRVSVTYLAGLAADWDGLPAGLRHGAVLLAARWFEERTAGAAPPAAVTVLWRPWRRVRLAEARR